MYVPVCLLARQYADSEICIWKALFLKRNFTKFNLSLWYGMVWYRCFFMFAYTVCMHRISRQPDQAANLTNKQTNE